MELTRFTSRALPAFLLSAAACGRPATESDCQLIVDRNIELQLREISINDLPTIKRRQAELQERMAPQVKECVGKRVTESGMKCVREANSTADIARCFK